jgi:hypothetical protein
MTAAADLLCPRMWLFFERLWERLAGWLTDPRKRRDPWDRS